jgi:hypothetical protein
VEVEVDVGSARIQDLNVMGLPDNTAEESRKRTPIESAVLRETRQIDFWAILQQATVPQSIRLEDHAGSFS